MPLLTVSEVAEKYLEQWLEGLTDGSLQLWALPPSVAAFYYAGYGEGCASRQLEIDQLERMVNRLHNLAFETNKERRDRIESRLSQALEIATEAQWAQVEADLAEMAGPAQQISNSQIGADTKSDVGRGNYDRKTQTRRRDAA